MSVSEDATSPPSLADQSPPPLTFQDRSLGRWLLWIGTVVVTVLLAAYVSLLATSEPITDRERQLVMDAVVVLDNTGFSKEASALRRFVSFRRTDNWWNHHVGHATAYAATNFPFAVITLYPTFFRYPVDDTERASILLHEASHLLGDDEEFALRRVWMAKERLGWTAVQYGHTRVWKNTREWTVSHIPSMFTCGEDGQSDCLE